MSADNNSDSNSNSDRIVQAMFRYDILNKLPRTGFLMRGVDNPESIGEHIFSTTVLAILILEEMAREGYEVDSAKVLKMAALHETGEILVGDIPHPAISYMGEEVKTRMEREAGKRVLEGFPALQELIEEFEGNETLEARIVYSLDKLQMLIKILLYESENKGHLDDFWRYAGNKRKIGIPVIDDIFDRLLELRGTFHLDYLGMT
ncbi:MAG: HD domain-containing protein [Spirochaetaceae bacterium]